MCWVISKVRQVAYVLIYECVSGAVIFTPLLLGEELVLTSTAWPGYHSLRRRISWRSLVSGLSADLWGCREQRLEPNSRHYSRSVTEETERLCHSNFLINRAVSNKISFHGLARMRGFNLKRIYLLLDKINYLLAFIHPVFVLAQTSGRIMHYLYWLQFECKFLYIKMKQ